MSLVSSLILKMRSGVLSRIMVVCVQNRVRAWRRGVVAVSRSLGGLMVRCVRPKPVTRQDHEVRSNREIYLCPSSCPGSTFTIHQTL